MADNARPTRCCMLGGVVCFALTRQKGKRMGILKRFFGSKPPPEEPTWEIVEKQLSVDHQRYQIRIKKGGRELYAEDLFQAAKTPRDLGFSRFFRLNENPPKPHFAASLQEAIDWFNGRKHPKDGYNTIWWGDRFTYECAICQAKRVVGLRITQVERLTVTSAIPTPREIVGWRVVEVESELTGKGIPTKKIDDFKTVPVVKWHEFPTRYLCGTCARKLAEVGRESEAAEAYIFEVK
jgi:hypothetical protein